MPAATWKKHQKAIADANQRNRQILNEKHALEIELDRVRLALEHATKRADEAEAKTMAVAYELAEERAARDRKKPHHRPLLDLELQALAGVCMLEALPETPARRRVINRIVEAICGDDE